MFLSCISDAVTTTMPMSDLQIPATPIPVSSVHTYPFGSIAGGTAAQDRDFEIPPSQKRDHLVSHTEAGIDSIPQVQQVTICYFIVIKKNFQSYITSILISCQCGARVFITSAM